MALGFRRLAKTTAAIGYYSVPMQRRMFWMIVIVLSLFADFLLPFWWGVAATIPIFALSWWIAYRSDWF